MVRRKKKIIGHLARLCPALGVRDAINITTLTYTPLLNPCSLFFDLLGLLVVLLIEKGQGSHRLAELNEFIVL
jgi:hypothetical protein